MRSFCATVYLNSLILSSVNCPFLTFSASFFGFFKIYPQYLFGDLRNQG